MKMRIIYLLILSLPGVLLAGKAMSQDGIEKKLFKEAFPELQGNLIDSNKTSLSMEENLQLRDLIKKLDNAQDDLNAFKIGANNENALVFKYKKLKKAGNKLNIEKLENLISAWKHNIKVFAGNFTIYGSPPHDSIINLSLFHQTCKLKKWEAAYKYWNVLFHYYPGASKMIYSKGADIMEYKFEQTKDLKWIDTLMMLYDQRIKYKFFGEGGEYSEGYILGRKAIDLLKYYKWDSVEEAYNTFRKSVKLRGVKSEDAVLLTYMQATEGMFVKNKINKHKVIDNFTVINAFLEERVKDSTNKDTPLALDGVTNIFINSKASTCKQLVSFFQKRIDTYKNNIEELEKIVRMIDRKECTDTKLFRDVLIAIDSLKRLTEPAHDSIAEIFKNKDYDKIIKYFEEAVSRETVDTLKAMLYYKLAQISNKMGKKAQARSYALQAISLKSNYGVPYILIATMYASSECSALTFPDCELQNVAYWAAVDKLVEAKSVDPSVSDVVNKLIKRYSGAYPNAEMAFQIGITKGQTVTIGCWINETTTVRF